MEPVEKTKVLKITNQEENSIKKYLNFIKKLGPKQFEAMFPGGAAELFNQVKNLESNEVQK